MTLVVASIEGDKIHLFSDTLISFEPGLGRRPYHALKILSLSPSTVIAFSGSHAQALEVFFELYSSRSSDLCIETLVNRVQVLCSAVSKKFGNQGSPDFLLACTVPRLAVYKITDQHITECPRHGWIGNSLAAANIVRVADLGNSAIQMKMNEVIADSMFDDVGGYMVGMQSHAGRFKFIPYMKLTSPRYIPVDGWNTIDFGTAQTGGFGFTTITPLEPGRNGWGLFFFQGFVGLFFHINEAGRRVEILKAYAQSAGEFMKILSAEVGFPLEHCGSLG